MKTSNPLTAICIVKENIWRAAESYAIAAIKNNVLGRNLFKQLSEFEKYHYDRYLRHHIFRPGQYESGQG